MVGINEGLISTEVVPFGGMKENRDATSSQAHLNRTGFAGGSNF